jgi:hypothetical protein
MPTDLSISPIVALAAICPGHHQHQPPQKAPAAASSAPPAVASETPHFTNPDIHIDPASNLVVMAFRNSAGKVVDQFPTQQQLDAYRLGNPPTPAPEG